MSNSAGGEKAGSSSLTIGVTGELPVERPTVLELVLNQKWRTRLGWNYRRPSSPAPTR